MTFFSVFEAMMPETKPPPPMTTLPHLKASAAWAPRCPAANKHAALAPAPAKKDLRLIRGNIDRKDSVNQDMGMNLGIVLGTATWEGERRKFHPSNLKAQRRRRH
jgi:hypothetical protein